MTTSIVHPLNHPSTRGLCERLKRGSGGLRASSERKANPRVTPYEALDRAIRSESSSWMLNSRSQYSDLCSSGPCRAGLTTPVRRTPCEPRSGPAAHKRSNLPSCSPMRDPSLRTQLYSDECSLSGDHTFVLHAHVVSDVCGRLVVRPHRSHRCCRQLPRCCSAAALLRCHALRCTALRCAVTAVLRCDALR